VRIDAHHHFWKYAEADFPWIDDSCPQLARDFTAEEFAGVIAAAGVEGSVLIQCLQTANENTMMFDLARRHDWIQGVVGWFPLTAPNVSDVLDAASEEPKLRGARIIMQGTPPDQFFENPAFHAGLDALASRGLVYDLLVNEPQLPATVALVDRHADLNFVLDHLGKPDVRAADPTRWLESFRELAQRPNVVAAKLSGLPMEADWANWTPGDLRPYFELALEHFGPSRLMFASDWPPCLSATSYQRWIDLVAAWISPLSASEQADIWSGTATRAYRLNGRTDQTPKGSVSQRSGDQI
jgi:L-fuconolactonase